MPVNGEAHPDPSMSSYVWSQKDKMWITSMGGGKLTHMYKGRSYTVHTGSRGGKYILVNKQHVYI